MATAVALSKVFILDKYFTELQKFWETEKKFKGTAAAMCAILLQQLISSFTTLRFHIFLLFCFTFKTLLKCVEMGENAKKICKSSSNVSSVVMPSARTNEITSEIHDLIHLSGPLTEDAVLRTLSARFLNKEYFFCITKAAVKRTPKQSTKCSLKLMCFAALMSAVYINALLFFSLPMHTTNVGPVLLSVNPYQNVGNPLTLSSTHQEASRYPQLLRVVQEAVRQQSETGYPQAIILSGESGSGKTFSSMLLLRQLFDMAGGGPETDSFKHLAAAFTVLRSLGSAKTATNSESSRIHVSPQGHFIEVQVTDGALYRTKIHSYFLDQTRVVKQSPNEKNYHIFYQMLAGLTKDERAKLNLEGYTIHNLRYLNHGDLSQNEAEDASRFEAWKTCLSVLGIPFVDVVRVLTAVLLLGNIQFNETLNGNSITAENAITCDAKTNNEIKAVAALLGVSSACIYCGLTTRTHNVRGQLIKSVCDGISASKTRDALAKALYCRTVATIVRRANSLKRIGTSCGTLSSDSNESVHNNVETSSHHASTIGSNGGKSYKSMNALNSAVRHATDGFIGILDMFGFEDSNPSHLEQLCINLCAETMQHFYNTHIFKSSMESLREETVKSEVEIDYNDNVACIDFISSLRTGLLSILDVESSLRGTSESYIQNIKSQHNGNSRYFDVNTNKAKAITSKSAVDIHQGSDHSSTRFFGIRHFAANVVYDANDFIQANRDMVPDDAIAVFHKSSCTFGFASHLFGLELKSLFSRDVAPRGSSFRISPTSHTDLQNGGEPISTLTQDFHTRLDNLLRTLVHARPHFVRCIKSNSNETSNHFDRNVVTRQIRALQVLETVALMAGGLPHRMRFRAFNSRYRCLAPFKKLKRLEDKAIDDSKVAILTHSILSENNCFAQILLDCFVKAIENIRSRSPASTSWAIGKRHIFLSEGVRQQLEMLRTAKRNSAAVLIQSVWREWHLRKRWPNLKKNLMSQKQALKTSNSFPAKLGGQKKPTALSAPALGSINRPRPQPITGTPPPEVCDQKVIQQTCTLFGLDLEHPPPVPPSRSYTVAGNAKLGYPQSRVMKMDFPAEEGHAEVQLRKGETVVVLGASQKRGHLLVEHNEVTLHVPFQYLELVSKGPGVVNI
ncbi:unconventional myosin-IXb-like protein [Leptotrombidium deliense]|uniref:Unconventional myosin-IXb-like protein n=1 Tax=Leptotrombidium deliense TaxID=299467 RepID=A0A443SWK2_9ACAR|nr:unconventional myosin-IXb-like protein [Leptotrombidium deliense]